MKQENTTTGTKFDSEKFRMDLISPVAIEELAKVLTFGAKKYDDWNWSKGIAYTRILAAVLRHTFAYLRGESKDPESGLSHMSHVFCNVMFLLHFEYYRPELDDRKKHEKS